MSADASNGFPCDVAGCDCGRTFKTRSGLSSHQNAMRAKAAAPSSSDSKSDSERTTTSQAPAPSSGGEDPKARAGSFWRDVWEGDPADEINQLP